MPFHTISIRCQYQNLFLTGEWKFPGAEPEFKHYEQRILI